MKINFFPLWLRLFACTVFLLVTACGKPEKRPGFGAVPRIDGAYANQALHAQLAFGPRPAGSDNAHKTADWILDEVRKMPAVASSEIMVFSDRTPVGEMEFRNVIAYIPGTGKQTVVVAAHYDTKMLESAPDFIGANDGASGVAALLAMLRAFPPDVKLPFSLCFVFFDGEECRLEYSGTDGFHGSRRLVADWKISGALTQVRAMILLDMVGDRELKIAFPSGCTPDLVDRALASAAKLGLGAYFERNGTDVLDDHTAFLSSGVPAIDFIDFEYGPGNLYWHTSGDTAARVSPESIKIAADAAFGLIWNLAEKE